MHIGDAAELTLQGRRQNNDGYLRAFATQGFSDVGSELAGAQVIVEHRDVDACSFASASSMELEVTT